MQCDEALRTPKQGVGQEISIRQVSMDLLSIFVAAFLAFRHADGDFAARSCTRCDCASLSSLRVTRFVYP